jgi:hypothetical protein
MPKLDYSRIAQKLADAFSQAESAVASGEFIEGNGGVDEDLTVLFASSTMSYREVLLGCVLAKLDDPSTDINKPYKKQSEHAFSGRTLDEKVVKPFSHEKRIPSTKNAYLSTFRRSVDLSISTRAGVDDTRAFDALLRLLEYVNGSDSASREAFLIRLLCFFVQLRERSSIAVAMLNRVSLVQYERLIDGLLGISSGGRIPVMLVTSMFHAFRECFGLPWRIECQGINEADSASGAGGDITIHGPSGILLVAEVTGRVVEKSRVVSTFNTKISPAGLEDYIFFVKEAKENVPAIAQAQQYFAQGSEVNFADIRTWLRMSLITIGKGGRSAFNAQLRDQLSSGDTPRYIKVAWNSLVENLTSV